jgi:hypothetical protein
MAWIENVWGMFFSFIGRLFLCSLAFFLWGGWRSRVVK